MQVEEKQQTAEFESGNLDGTETRLRTRLKMGSNKNVPRRFGTCAFVGTRIRALDLGFWSYDFSFRIAKGNTVQMMTKRDI